MERRLAEVESIRFRRRPRQQRAEQTVARIMDAALALILEDGYSSLTTNRIAEKAGVNIASLYQYFPGKLAIAHAIYERAVAEYTGIVNVTIMAEMPTPLAEGLSRIIRRTVRFMARERRVFVRLVDEVPELRQSVAASSLEALSFEVSQRYVRHHLPGRDEATIRLRTFCLQHAALPLVTRFLLDRPGGISQERFIGELSRICVAIIEG